MKNLPANIPQHLVATIDTSDQDDQILEKFNRMKASMSELAETYEAEAQKVTELMAKLNGVNFEILQEIQECEQALDKIIEDNQEDIEDVEAFLGKMEEDESGDTPKPEAELEETERNKARMVSILFKEIALKTHPDRSKNPAHKDLFMEAQKAYKKGDLETLTEIHSKVFNKPYTKIPLTERLKQLEIQFSALFNEFQAHRQSEEYKIYQIFLCYGQSYAEQTHRAILKEILSQRKRDLTHAREF